MNRITNRNFDTQTFLATEGPGRSIRREAARQDIFRQGGPADAVFYLQNGRAKLTVISKRGKEATVTLLAPGDFFGDGRSGSAANCNSVSGFRLHGAQNREGKDAPRPA